MFICSASNECDLWRPFPTVFCYCCTHLRPRIYSLLCLVFEPLYENGRQIRIVYSLYMYIIYISVRTRVSESNTAGDCSTRPVRRVKSVSSFRSKSVEYIIQCVLYDRSRCRMFGWTKFIDDFFSLYYYYYSTFHCFTERTVHRSSTVNSDDNNNDK